MSLEIRLAEVPTQLRLGVSAAERAAPQAILVSVTAELAEGPREDTLESTVDYDALIGFVRDGLPSAGPVLLIETVAQRVAQAALALSPEIAAVTVEVKKPSVLAASGGMVSVRLRQVRSAA